MTAAESATGKGRVRRRLARLGPHLLGLTAAILLLWRGGVELEERAEAGRAVGDLGLEVEAPASVVDLEASGEPRWEARVEPADLRERVRLWVDDRPVAAPVDPDSGVVNLQLPELASQPGWHFVAAGIERRGNRREVAVDPLLVGRFADANPEEKPCALSLRASSALVEQLLLTMLEDELMPKLRANEHMGPDTVLREAKLELRDDALRFELE
ncbi:MAG: hypothetical protein KC457_25670, partial [Myxococcales bacterium]|nr:hypothetical protein [Myxococcales bacterium]